MTLRKKIDDLYDRFESIESESNVITGVLFQSEAKTYQAAGFTIGGVLLLPEPLTRDEWLSKAQNLSEQQALDDEGRAKYGIHPVKGNDAPAVQPRPYQEPHIPKNNGFGFMGRG